MTKPLPPGSLAPSSGTYEQVSPAGRTGVQVRVLHGRPLPATLAAGNAWELVAADGGRAPPEMQVVTKGWWRLKEERASAEELEQEDRNERQQA